MAPEAARLGALLSMGRWLLLVCGVAVLAGTASAFFLIALDWATDTRTRLPWLLALLPLAGLAVGWVYHRYGQSVEAGKQPADR